VILLASRVHDPRAALFAGGHAEPEWPVDDHGACGFYWTEGNTGLGWAVDAIPTLKGGSALAIPSPPAVWLRNGFIGVPDIRDGERLQGFPVDWTKPAKDADYRGDRARWRLIGNAVSVPVAKWLGQRLAMSRGDFDASESRRLVGNFRWPAAAWSDVQGKIYGHPVSAWPVQYKYRDLAPFLRYPLLPLSARATEGFLSRVTASSLRYPAEFHADLVRHQELMAAA
jgi:DNA (cytosine-5)-methyltransferase 1